MTSISNASVIAASNLRFRFEKDGESATRVYASGRIPVSDGKSKRFEFLAAMISDMAVADRKAQEEMESDVAKVMQHQSRYFVRVYSQPRFEDFRGLPGIFECHGAVAFRPSRNQATAFIKDHFGVTAVE